MRALSHVNNKTRFGAKLPKKFRGYFWDCDFSALSLERSRTFILKRPFAVWWQGCDGVDFASFHPH